MAVASKDWISRDRETVFSFTNAQTCSGN